MLQPATSAHDAYRLAAKLDTGPVAKGYSGDPLHLLVFKTFTVRMCISWFALLRRVHQFPAGFRQKAARQ